MRDMKRIKINVNQAKAEEMFKKTFRRYETGFEEKTKGCGHAVCGCNVTGHTPAENQFLNKLTVGVCVVAALITYAAYHFLPKIN